MIYVWVIVLYNFLHMQQAVLPSQYQTQNDCNVARVQMGYSQFSPLGVHGVCELRHK